MRPFPRYEEHITLDACTYPWLTAASLVGEYLLSDKTEEEKRRILDNTRVNCVQRLLNKVLKRMYFPIEFDIMALLEYLWKKRFIYPVQQKQRRKQSATEGKMKHLTKDKEERPLSEPQLMELDIEYWQDIPILSESESAHRSTPIILCGDTFENVTPDSNESSAAVSMRDKKGLESISTTAVEKTITNPSLIDIHKETPAEGQHHTTSAKRKTFSRSLWYQWVDKFKNKNTHSPVKTLFSNRTTDYQVCDVREQNQDAHESKIACQDTLKLSSRSVHQEASFVSLWAPFYTHDVCLFASQEEVERTGLLYNGNRYALDHVTLDVLQTSYASLKFVSAGTREDETAWSMHLFMLLSSRNEIRSVDLNILQDIALEANVLEKVMSIIDTRASEIGGEGNDQAVEVRVKLGYACLLLLAQLCLIEAGVHRFTALEGFSKIIKLLAKIDSPEYDTQDPALHIMKHSYLNAVCRILISVDQHTPLVEANTWIADISSRITRSLAECSQDTYENNRTHIALGFTVLRILLPLLMTTEIEVSLNIPLLTHILTLESNNKWVVQNIIALLYTVHTRNSEEVIQENSDYNLVVFWESLVQSCIRYHDDVQITQRALFMLQKAFKDQCQAGTPTAGTVAQLTSLVMSYTDASDYILDEIAPLLRSLNQLLMESSSIDFVAHVLRKTSLDTPTCCNEYYPCNEYSA